LGDSEVDVLLFDKVIFSKGTSGVTLIEYKQSNSKKEGSTWQHLHKLAYLELISWRNGVKTRKV
jgi:hypothetical protein